MNDSMSGMRDRRILAGLRQSSEPTEQACWLKFSFGGLMESLVLVIGIVWVDE